VIGKNQKQPDRASPMPELFPLDGALFDQCHKMRLSKCRVFEKLAGQVVGVLVDMFFYGSVDNI
jgi:hypothetical protein